MTRKHFAFCAKSYKEYKAAEAKYMEEREAALKAAAQAE